jgi:hypothetical protein
MARKTHIVAGRTQDGTMKTIKTFTAPEMVEQIGEIAYLHRQVNKYIDRAAIACHIADSQPITFRSAYHLLNLLDY